MKALDCLYVHPPYSCFQSCPSHAIGVIPDTETRKKRSMLARHFALIPCGSTKSRLAESHRPAMLREISSFECPSSIRVFSAYPASKRSAISHETFDGSYESASQKARPKRPNRPDLVRAGQCQPGRQGDEPREGRGRVARHDTVSLDSFVVIRLSLVESGSLEFF